MKEARAAMAQAWNQMYQMPRKYNLKQKMDNPEIESLICDIEAIRESLHVAQREAARHMESTLYAIAKETTPGEFEAFTHGPTTSKEEMLAVSAEDGDILVALVQKDQKITKTGIAGYLDGEWMEIDE